MKSFFLLFLLLVSSFAFAQKTPRINGFIKEARACKAKADCVTVGSHCPFGCHIYVNKAQASVVQDMIQAYNAKVPQPCNYKCTETKGVDCVNGLCTGL